MLLRHLVMLVALVQVRFLLEFYEQLSRNLVTSQLQWEQRGKQYEKQGLLPCDPICPLGIAQ